MNLSSTFDWYDLRTGIWFAISEAVLQAVNGIQTGGEAVKLTDVATDKVMHEIVRKSIALSPEQLAAFRSMPTNPATLSANGIEI